MKYDILEGLTELGYSQANAENLLNRYEEEIRGEQRALLAEVFDRWATRWKTWGSSPADEQTLSFAVQTLAWLKGDDENAAHE